MKLFLILPVIFILNTLAFAQEWTWKPFSPKNQPWTILAPAPLKPDAEALDPDGKKGSYSFNDYNGFFAVIFRDSPRRYLPWKPDYGAYINKVSNDVAEANKGKIIKDIEFSNRGLKGREVEVKFPSGTTRGAEGQTVYKYRVQRFRMFFVGSRFYIVLAVLPESEIDKPFIDTYLNSFVLNTAPIAKADLYSVDEDSTLKVSASSGVLANDTDAEKDPLSVAESKPLTNPAHGTLTMNVDGSFNYQPEPNFNGQDSFTYKNNDGLTDSSAATVTIVVNPVNDPPTISGIPATVSVDELTPLTLTATAADIDNPVESLRFSLTGSSFGASINPKTGVLSWTPEEAQGPGTYTFQVKVTDGTATVGTPLNVTVREVNVAPKFSTAPVSATIKELEPYSFSVQAVDTDLPKQDLTYSLVGAPEGAAINSSTGSISWTPTEAQGNNSTYQFTVKVSDGVAAAEQPFSLRVQEVNTAPNLTAVSDQTIDEMTPLSLTVKAADADIPANDITYSLDSSAPAGMTINAKSGVISWTPNESQGAGDYAITVRAADNGTPALADSKTFKVHVNEVNIAPVAENSAVSLDEDNSITIALKATDADLPANKLTYSVISNPTHGKLSGSDSNLIYQPDANFNGSDSFTFTVNDGLTNSNTATVSINVKPVNDSPTARPDDATTTSDTPVTINVVANDSDIDGDKISLASVSDAINGTVEIVGGEARFTPKPGYQGDGGFKYTISDGHGGQASATVTIRINPAKPGN